MPPRLKPTLSALGKARTLDGITCPWRRGDYASADPGTITRDASLGMRR